jgi:hypothetical protein
MRRVRRKRKVLVSARDFSLVVVRLFGLWVLYQTIFVVEQFFGLTFFVPDPTYRRFVVSMSAFNVIVNVVVGIGLVWKPHIVVNRLLPQGVEGQKELRLSATRLIFVCFSIAGVVFLVSGLKDLAAYTAEWLFKPAPPLEVPKVAWSAIIRSSVETAAGLWLLFGIKGIVRGLRRMWKAGRTMESAPSEGE